MGHAKWESHPDAPSLIRDSKTGDRLYSISFDVGWRPEKSIRLEILRMIAAAPDLEESCLYVDAVAPTVEETADLDDDGVIFVTMTFKALRDLRAALAKVKGAK